MQQLPEGLWPVMLTPFKANNEVDHTALRRLTEFYINAGSTGLFANCLSSEMFQLTGEERLAVTRTVVEAAGKVPVVSVGSFGSDTQINADFIKQIYDTGAAAVVISTSQICAQMEADDILKKRFEDLLKATGDIPLGLYECPVPYKRLLSPEILGWLAHTGRFLYHKDTCCDLEVIKQKIAATQGTPMGIYNAHMPTGVASIQCGARGLSPIGANLYPELLSYLANNANKYNKIPAKLEATLSLMDTQIHHNYPYTAKLFLQKRGMDIHAEGRTPRGEMTAHDYDKLDAMYLVFEQLCFENEIVFENSIPK